MVKNIGIVTAMRCISGEGGNLYFQISEVDKTFVIKGDDAGRDAYASILAASLAASSSTKLVVSVESEPYEPQPNYHAVSQIYAGKWRSL